MAEPVWTFQHSVDCRVPRQFAWNFWSDIRNWDDPPARFELTGRFESGSHLRTILPGEILHSVLRDVQSGQHATVEMELPDALLRFHWTFVEVAAAHSQITQSLILEGPNARAFVEQARALEQSVPQGMAKLVALIERSAAAACTKS